MAKVRLNLWVDGPPINAPGDIHGTLKSFNCADLATEMPSNYITYTKYNTGGANDWEINDTTIRFFAMTFSSTDAYQYILIDGCEPILDSGFIGSKVSDDPAIYDILGSDTQVFTQHTFSSRPDDWYVRGHSKYYEKFSANGFNRYVPVGYTETSYQYSPITFNSSKTYYTCNKNPYAADVYFNSQAHFGFANIVDDLRMTTASITRYTAPPNFNWRPSYPLLSGAIPGGYQLWYDFIYNTIGANNMLFSYDNIINGSAWRLKVYAFAHNFTPTGDTEEKTFIGFLMVSVDALGTIQDARALLMDQEVATTIIKTPDGGEISGIEGGDGTWDDESDGQGDGDGDTTGAEVVRENSVVSVVSSGFNKYWSHFATGLPQTGAIAEFIGNLFSPSIWQGWKNIQFNPLQAIVACHFLPSELAPKTAGTPSQIMAAGAVLSESTMDTFTETDMLTTAHFGPISLSKYMGSFADITDTEIYIHLPYIGDVKLDNKILAPNRVDVATTQLSVDYICDVWTGDCVARIWVQDNQGIGRDKYEFRGNCAKPVYLYQYVPRSSKIIASAASTGSDLAVDIASTYLRYDSDLQLANDMVNVDKQRSFLPTQMVNFNETSEVNKAIRMNMAIKANQSQAGALARSSKRQSLINSVSSATKSFINSALNATAQITSCNNSSGSANLPVINEIFLTIIRPVWSDPENYGELLGYPSDIGGTIESGSEFAPFEGYLQVREIKLDGISAENKEKQEIEQLLKTGVYIGSRTI